MIYAGFTLLLLPLIISAEPQSLTLSNTPQIFGFEDNLSSVNSIYGTPIAVTWPVANGGKAIECQNGDYVRWNLAKPSKTIDLSFEIYLTKLPSIANESLTVVEIWGSDAKMWIDIFSTSFYCDSNGYRGWMIWTSIPTGRGSFVSGDVVYTLETNRWYIIRITADLNTGTYKLYLDGTELTSISGVVDPTDVYVDFFQLGVGAKGDSIFNTYYDDVSVSNRASTILEPNPEYNYFPLQVIGLVMIIGGGYALWPQKKRESTKISISRAEDNV